MITLHGFAASNYYNVVKHVLLYKALPFNEHLIYTSDDALLTINPMGKVPAITTADGVNIAESSVICDYLEEAFPSNPLYPNNPESRALVRQIMKIAELYFELPSRRLIPYAFTGTQAPESLKDEVRTLLTRGVNALCQLTHFSTWVVGEQFTMADIYLYYVNTIVTAFGSSQLEWDVIADIPGMKQWQITLSQSPIAQQIEADRQANMPEFMQKVTAQIQAAQGQ
ncbi:glutathione S-transferase family protein [Pseudoalteromonas sp. MMG010]|uniref:glutathione S-transferase family protein n=1 Tax=Pseudoalteromonas sp. MMG010 TaxID=2822685 RepID=UPI001B3A0E05|nr:glutathione S-transferase family protein [Pseudoalteromonas sp. MMG010]MBQ4833571.1 glutathione S-transferase family protein [Pseudoalteromonas sp. MMG010]